MFEVVVVEYGLLQLPKLRKTDISKSDSLT